MCQAIAETTEGLLKGNTGGGNSFFESLLDAGLNYASFGALGYQSDKGGFGEGLGTRSTKDIMGVTAAEEANELTRQQISEAKAQAAKEREDALSQNAADQVAKSRQASAVRSTANRSNVGASSVSTMGGTERDFLGL